MIGKYGLWVYPSPPIPYPIYTRCKIVAIQDGKYVVNPIHLSGHTLKLTEKEIFIITRKNS